MLEDGLPPNWMRNSWEEGTQRNVYLDTETETESTVHPSRFLNLEDKVSHVLPPGWDRRLDSWGNLFFVDHHTRRATREDPRFDNKTDQQTGLPKGWFEIKDHRDKQYFYTKIGRMIFGTYEPAAMNSKSQKHKLTLSAIPKNNEDPRIVVSVSLPLARRIEEREEKAAAAANALAAAQTIPQMTEEERKAYRDIFRAIEKRDPSRLSQSEALEHCMRFEVPLDIASKILDQHDSNKDRRWNGDEYAEVLHEIRFELEKRLRAKPIPPMMTEDEQKYTTMFYAGKSPDSEVMVRSEVEALCKDFELPKDLIKKIFVRADKNKDSSWNIDEFISAMHRVMHEVEKRDGMPSFFSNVQQLTLIRTAQVHPTCATRNIDDDCSSAGKC
jgi:Ca2+-binding EF-hand superfamily protein